ncbi:hypothetical protein [Microvirga sesbaniae]|nr:hypothetical protein [Microvirga sp. HBU67692]
MRPQDGRHEAGDDRPAMTGRVSARKRVPAATGEAPGAALWVRTMR